MRVQNRPGFTLIEILVVLGIVMVLSTISFAVFVRGRENGRNTTCQSNLKQLALAMQQYVSDHDGHFPSNLYVLDRDTPKARIVQWHDAILPYVTDMTIVQCPASGRRDPLDSDYGFNAKQLNDMIWSPNRDPRRNRMVGAQESRQPSALTVVLNADTWVHYYDSDTLVNGSVIETSCGSHSVGSLHLGGANYSYLDGHVKWLSQTQQGEMLCSNG